MVLVQEPFRRDQITLYKASWERSLISHPDGRRLYSILLCLSILALLGLQVFLAPWDGREVMCRGVYLLNGKRSRASFWHSSPALGNLTLNPKLKCVKLVHLNQGKHHSRLTRQYFPPNISPKMCPPK